MNIQSITSSCRKFIVAVKAVVTVHNLHRKTVECSVLPSGNNGAFVRSRTAVSSFTV